MFDYMLDLHFKFFDKLDLSFAKFNSIQSISVVTHIFNLYLNK